MSGILQKYSDLRQHKDANRVTSLQEQLGHMDKAQLDEIYAGSGEGGIAFLQESPGETNCVLETVVSTHGDSISSMYVGHPVFQPRQRYVDARKELISLINDIAQAPQSGAVIMCSVRNRPVRVRELTLAQLIDVADFASKQLLAR